MDGTVEAHNISFGCGLSAINIALPRAQCDWSHLKNQDFEQRSEENGGAWCHYLSFISYQITLQLLHPPSAKWHKSLMLLVALWKIRPQWSKNNHSFQHFTSSGDALHSSISEPLQSQMMILSITYLFPVGEVKRLKKKEEEVTERQMGNPVPPQTHTHTHKYRHTLLKSDTFCTALISSTVWLLHE